MYVLICYDAVDGRTEVFRKLLSRFLVHEQNSVFAGNITESKLLKLKKALQIAAMPDDRLLLVSAANRHNVKVQKMSKEENGILAEIENDHHAKSTIII